LLIQLFIPKGTELCLKKTALYTALLALSLPLCVHALGLGQMTVESALDQPFLAEIELIDLQSAPIASVKAALASPQNFERLGIAPADILSVLQFEVKKNKQGRFVVRIHSSERISEPYIQLAVDLTWPKGQLYKVYTVLLDPPGYKLGVTTAQSGPTYHQRIIHVRSDKSAPPIAATNTEPVVREDTITYGPTIANENVWQIAQQYKTSDTILPQIVLAIVGQNPDAFNEGNLNGLKVGVKLRIPSAAKMMRVPSDLATVEVMAHDKAWNEKASINHVLSPPYMNEPTSTENSAVEYSKIPPVPQLKQSMLIPAETMPQLLPSSELPSIQNQQVSTGHDETLKAEISITTAAVDSLRESNAMLVEQLHLMQTENKKLHEQLEEREKQLKVIHNQIQVMKKERLVLEGQASSSGTNKDSVNFWPVLFLLTMAGGGGGAAFWHFKRREPKENDASVVEKAPEPMVMPVVSALPIITPIEEPVEQKPEPEVRAEPEVQPEPQVSEEEPPSDQPELLLTVDEQPNFQITEESSPDNLLEFESGLHQLLTEKPAIQENSTQETTEDKQEEGLEFTPGLSIDTEQSTAPEENKEVKNTNALDTLLDLARTYIGMEDKESALQSLNEVMEQGTESQKAAAQRLIDEIKGNNS
jgi:pilus assembly protein FimV